MHVVYLFCIYESSPASSLPADINTMLYGCHKVWTASPYVPIGHVYDLHLRWRSRRMGYVRPIHRDHLLQIQYYNAPSKLRWPGGALWTLRHGYIY